MSSMQKQITSFIEEQDIKFVRLAFCDIMGNLKNVSISSEELGKAFTSGISFDASAIKGFGSLENSDLLLFPEADSMQVLPWRPSTGKVMQMYCDIYHTNGKSFEKDTRGMTKEFLRSASLKGYTFKIGSECEFYLFKLNEEGDPTLTPLDHGGYFDVAPTDKGENIRRDICLTLQEMGFHTERSHHESGPGQMEVDFSYGDLMSAANNMITFKYVVRTTASRNGLFASFLPKPLKNESGSGMHVNISIKKEGCEDEEAIRRYTIAGILSHIKEISIFTSPHVNSYARLGSFESPSSIGWGYANRTLAIRVPRTQGEYARVEVRTADASANPYLLYTLLCKAAMEGIEKKMDPPKPVENNAFYAFKGESLPTSLEESVTIAEQSDFLKKALPQELLASYITEVKKEIEEYKLSKQTFEESRDRFFSYL